MSIRFWGFSLLLALCFFLFFWQLGSIPFYERGEAREGLVVWEMYKTGNWVLPIINGDYIPFKPPFFHWIGVLISAMIGDVNELTIRIPSALFATLGVVLVFTVGSQLWNEKTGLLAGGILATNSQWWRSATIAQVDMTLAFFMATALLLFYFMYREGKYGKAYSVGLALLLSFATLAKGPIGLLLPLLTMIVFLWLRDDFPFLKKLHSVSGALVFLIVAGGWYGLALWQGGSTFWVRQIIEENLGTAGGNYGRYQPPYYFVPVFFLNLAPWSFFSPSIVIFLYHRRRELFQNHLLFLSVWLATIFAFFSLASGKRGVYILPLFPAFALLFGAWWGSLDKHSLVYARWLTSAVAYLVSVSVLLALVGMAFLIFESSGEQEHRILPLVRNSKGLNEVLSFLTPPSVPVWICLVVFGAAALLILWSLPWEKWNGVFVGFAFMAAATNLFLKTTYYPAFASQRTLKLFAVRLGDNVDPQTPLLFYNSFDYGTIFYSRRHIAQYGQNVNELKQPAFLLMWEEDWERLRQKNDLEMLDISEGRGPAAEHRLALVKSSRLLPIPDTEREIHRDSAQSVSK